MSETRLGSRSPQLLKRGHDEDDDLEKPPYMSDSEEFNSFLVPPSIRPNILEETSTRDSSHINRATSPACSSTGSLSDVGTATPSKTPNSPATAFAALNGIAQPPKKRVKLTFAEKEEKRLLKAVRDQEKAEERANKEAERKTREEEKARKDAEKDAERKKKEAEKEERRLVKEAEKAEKEKERKARDDEKRRKEQEKQRSEDEKRKKERAQLKLNAFFKASNTVSKEDSPRKPQCQTSDAPVPSASVSITKSPSKNNTTSYYEEKFRPFFVQSKVKIAPMTQFTRDESVSKALQDTIDSYIYGRRDSEGLQPFDAARLFNVPDMRLKSRGRKIKSVREIISHILGDAKRPIDLTTDSQHLKIKNTRDLLKSVPYKILSFAEDIRPPYKGTYTSQPMTSMHKLARSPARRDLPLVNYDDDSEAEWEAEDGEDIESEGDEDEDVGEGEEDLDEFLDDAEVETVNARKLVLQADLEPKCSGLCWEDEKRRGPNVKMYRYVMEFITGQLLYFYLLILELTLRR
jgi:chromatin assembly factor 1 subunit A